MDIEKLISPDVSGRKTISRGMLEAGDVVAFITECGGRLRTGLMALSEESQFWFNWAVNLYKEDGREWTYDYVPDTDIIFFEATKAEKAYALCNSLAQINLFWHENLLNDEGRKGKEEFDAILKRIVELSE